MTTLIIDYNNISLMACFSKDCGMQTDEPNYRIWEFMVFERIYDYIRKFKNITEVIIAQDNKQYWRRKYWPRYKEKRAEQKEKMDVDWDTFYSYMNKLFIDIKNHFPFKCINIKYCEADDTIGHLGLTLNRDIVILSSDSDYKQLLTKRVKCFSPYTQKYLECKDPEKFLLESCLMGQAKDAIFNVITPEDYPIELRKPGFGPKKLETWISTGLDIMLNKKIKYNKPTYKGEVLPKDRFHRNQVLMDFRKIPKVLTKEIDVTYNTYELPEIGKSYDFFVQKNWNRFLQEFELTERKLITLY